MSFEYNKKQISKKKDLPPSFHVAPLRLCVKPFVAVLVLRCLNFRRVYAKQRIAWAITCTLPEINECSKITLHAHNIELPIFTLFADDYFTEGELADVKTAITNDPTVGDVVPGTRGVRKLRWKRQGRGKLGGVCVLYYVQDARGRIWLLTVYAKSTQENIAASTLNALREIAEHAEII